MKNIHVLPTPLPSRLVINNDKNTYTLLSGFIKSNPAYTTQHIYITSDEKVKDGEYCITKTNEVIRFKKSYTQGFLYKKIILTTDQDLIKDGIQSIDDEFLEWFVKNPSCLYAIVDKEEGFYEIFIPGINIEDEIIIPSEEVLIQSSIDGKAIWSTAKETLEEAAERHHDTFTRDLSFAETRKESFIKGAKWQQSKALYSDEEVLNILDKMFEWYIDDTPYYFNLAMLKSKFEEFKKK